MNRLKRFPEIFVLTNTFCYKVRKLQNLALGNPPFSYFCFISIGYVNTPKYVFCLIVPLRSFQSLLSASAKSTTTPTPCPCCQQLRWQFDCVVNAYADIMSSVVNDYLACVRVVNDYTNKQCSEISHSFFSIIFLFSQWSGAPRFATSDTYVFREYCRKKRKISQNHFWLINWGPCRVFIYLNKCRKSRDTFPSR